jgi:hypothetical protein
MQTFKRAASLLVWAVLIPAAMMGACQAQTAAEPFVVADLFATPGKALATVEVSPTPSPTPTLPNVPSPTPGPTLPIPTVRVLAQATLPIGTFGPTPTLEGEPPLLLSGTPPPAPVSCATAPPMPFTPIWQNLAQVQSLMRCPAGDPFEVPGVWQGFEHGAMFWRQNDRGIFVLSELAIRQGQLTDAWWRVDDTWQEGEPENDPNLQPPEGLRQPVRGFGKVWRSNAFVRDGVGWAVGEEIGMTSLWLSFEGGWMMTGPNGAPIYVLVPNDAPPYSSGIHLGPLP